jgi:hypothetical protein
MSGRLTLWGSTEFFFKPDECVISFAIDKRYEGFKDPKQTVCLVLLLLFLVWR